MKLLLYSVFQVVGFVSSRATKVGQRLISIAPNRVGIGIHCETFQSIISRLMDRQIILQSGWSDCQSRFDLDAARKKVGWARFDQAGFEMPRAGIAIA